jgi:ABC-type enterochelin transport system permease subunit
MSGDLTVAAIALVMCAILVTAGIQHRGGFRANARLAAIWVAIIVGVTLLVRWLGGA